jgi:hypothetical protein
MRLAGRQRIESVEFTEPLTASATRYYRVITTE